MFGWSENEERNWWARDWGENTNENRSYNFRWNFLARSKLFYLCAYPFLFCLFFFISYQVIIPFCVCMCVFFIKNLFMCLSLLLAFFDIIIIFFIFFPSVQSSFLFSTVFFFFFFEKKFFRSWTSCALYFWLNEVLIHTQFSNKAMGSDGWVSGGWVLVG